MVYKGFSKDKVKITPWEYDPNLSDHKAIQVKIKLDVVKNEYTGGSIEMVDKKWLKKESLRTLQ